LISGWRNSGCLNKKKRLSHYRRFVYEKGGLERQRSEIGGQRSKRGQRSEVRGRKKEKSKDYEGYEIGIVDRFRYRTRYFTDSGIIGSKVFVDRVYRQFKDHFTSKHEKQPRTIKGLEGLYSLKRLSEAI
jgi:putative transposase